MPPRHPEVTRARILAAALREFSRKGLAGARVDAIARAARVNKRMLYHYFGNKEGLYRAVLREKLCRKAGVRAASPPDPAGSLPFWFAEALSDPEWLRLLQWEALEGHRTTIAATERRVGYEGAIEMIRGQQEAGTLPGELPADRLLLAMAALASYPLVFPQVCRLVTGLDPHDERFRQSQVKFLAAIGRCLTAAADGEKSTPRPRPGGGKRSRPEKTGAPQ